ncbi:retinol dehydrogenase 13-like [Chelonus insularis]|uniref:retinol dehydrogenase 13-like n=1 Tax=Chelonus insularis TaxID=460826 RepID=UPI00158BFED6|nr:retinol dehydrogenase 13-like [Chelonus insularis]
MRKIKIPTWIFLGSVTCTGIGAAFIFRDKLGGGSARGCDKYDGKEKLEGKVVIVTGANSGIGKEVVRDLAERQAKVVMACRDLISCEEARMKIVLETENKYIYCRKCDLSSQASIREFVNKFKSEHKRLDILINNAGIMRCPLNVTKDGIETQLGVNHMGHFLLTNLLLDRLKQSAPARVINVSSAAHKSGKIKVDDLNSVNSYDPADAYAQSKLANILFTRELAKRLEGTGVTVNAVHPGVVDTQITRHMAFSKSKLAKPFVKPFLWLLTKTPVQGAQPILKLALDPSLEKVTGAYFSEFSQTDPSEEAQNDVLAKWLWVTSEKWTKLEVG